MAVVDGEEAMMGDYVDPKPALLSDHPMFYAWPMLKLFTGFPFDKWKPYVWAEGLSADESLKRQGEYLKAQDDFREQRAREFLAWLEFYEPHHTRIYIEDQLGYGPRPKPKRGGIPSPEEAGMNG